MSLNAWYRLNEYPCSFNFFEFLVAAVTEGATRVWFDDTAGIRHKYPDDVTKERIKSILEPGCALADVPFSWGRPPKEGSVDPGVGFGAVLNAYKKHRRIAKLKSVLPPVECRATITLRNYTRKGNRNSNKKEWKRLAERLGAVVIPDYADAPIHLHERMALYAGAKMNFFVANGPAEIVVASEYPFAVMFSHIHDSAHGPSGWPMGMEVLPWANKNQRGFFLDDTQENIERVYNWSREFL